MSKNNETFDKGFQQYSNPLTESFLKFIYEVEYWIDICMKNIELQQETLISESRDEAQMDLQLHCNNNSGYAQLLYIAVNLQKYWLFLPFMLPGLLMQSFKCG